MGPGRGGDHPSPPRYKAWLVPQATGTPHAMQQPAAVTAAPHALQFAFSRGAAADSTRAQVPAPGYVLHTRHRNPSPHAHTERAGHAAHTHHCFLSAVSVVPLLLQTRTDAPPVFINPIRNGLPGNILGPEDLERRG